MTDLSVEYMGIPLKNPIVVSSSNLTGTAAGVEKCAKAGAGAIVLKSLFEEQIEAEIEPEQDQSDVSVHPEAEEYIREMGMRLGPKAYLDLIGHAKKATDIPVIASVNCVTVRWWTHYATQIEHAGADGVELNISILPRDHSVSAESIEKQFTRIVGRVRDLISIPIAVKLGPYFTSLPAFCSDLKRAGASAIVLFNRFYQLDINEKTLKLAPGYQFSSPNEIHTALRWISILSGRYPLDFAASTGVHDSAGAAKVLLAGATVAQICSTVYLNGFEQISQTVAGLSDWMEEHKFSRVSDYRGKLSQKESGLPESYERLQYIKALTGIA